MGEAGVAKLLSFLHPQRFVGVCHISAVSQNGAHANSPFVKDRMKQGGVINTMRPKCRSNYRRNTSPKCLLDLFNLLIRVLAQLLRHRRVELQRINIPHVCRAAAVSCSEVHAHLGALERDVGRAAGPPFRAGPAKLRRGMRGPFGGILAEVGGEDWALELSDSSLCSMSTK